MANEYLVKGESLTAVADKIRILNGSSDTMGLDVMAANVGAANDEIDSQTELLVQITTALGNKVNVSPKLQNKTITPTKSVQSVIADDGYDALGRVVVEAISDEFIVPSGSIEINENGTYDVIEKADVVVAIPEKEIALQDKKFTENGIYSADEGYDGLRQVTVNVPVSEYTEPILQEKSVTPTKSTQEVVADNGYDGLYKVSVWAIPNEYIIPSGTKNITANGTHDVADYKSVSVDVPIPDGYIQPSGTQEINANGTYNVTEKASVVVSVPEREIVLQDKEFTENGTYSADDGYDGFGQVTVNVSGSVNTEAEQMAQLLMNTLTTLDNSVATSLRSRVCQGATKLATANLPSVTSIGTYAFYGCTRLITVHFPLATSIPSQSFYSCTKLKHADFGQAGSIAAQAFNACSVLTELILRKSDAICTLSNTNGVNNTPIGKGTGYVYVPAALVETYKTATNWATFANQIRAIEDYPEICG